MSEINKVNRILVSDINRISELNANDAVRINGELLSSPSPPPTPSAYNNVPVLDASVSVNWASATKHLNVLPGIQSASNMFCAGDYIYCPEFYTGKLWRAPTSDPLTWEIYLADLPGAAPRYSAPAIIDGSVYLYGPGTQIIYASLSDLSSWTLSGTSLPRTFGYGTSLLSDTNVYLMGGFSNKNEYMYAPLNDPTNFSYSTYSNDLNPTGFAFRYNNTYYHVGGDEVNYGATPETIQTNTKVCIPSKNWWRQGVVIGSNLYVIGDLAEVREVDLTGPMTSSTVVGTIPESPFLFYGSMVAVQNKLYLFGGNTGSFNVDSAISFDLTGNTTNQPS